MRRVKGASGNTRGEGRRTRWVLLDTPAGGEESPRRVPQAPAGPAAPPHGAPAQSRSPVLRARAQPPDRTKRIHPLAGRTPSLCPPFTDGGSGGRGCEEGKSREPQGAVGRVPFLDSRGLGREEGASRSFRDSPEGGFGGSRSQSTRSRALFPRGSSHRSPRSLALGPPPGMAAGGVCSQRPRPPRGCVSPGVRPPSMPSRVHPRAGVSPSLLASALLPRRGGTRLSEPPSSLPCFEKRLDPQKGGGGSDL